MSGTDEGCGKPAAVMLTLSKTFRRWLCADCPAPPKVRSSPWKDEGLPRVCGDSTEKDRKRERAAWYEKLKEAGRLRVEREKAHAEQVKAAVAAAAEAKKKADEEAESALNDRIEKAVAKALAAKK